MKSFVSYPFDLEKMSFYDVSENSYSGKLRAYYELYNKVSLLEGSVVMCGITASNGLAPLAFFRNLIASGCPQEIVAFEKIAKNWYVEDYSAKKGKLLYKIEDNALKNSNIQEALRLNAITEQINFIPGNVDETIPDFLIANPDVKISFMNIDFDDYESTLTTLQFFYPRLVQDGILILNNFYKEEEEYEAVNDYFKYSEVSINNFSADEGPHYIIRN